MLTIFGCHGCGVLGEYDESAWASFVSRSTSSYKDDRVSCVYNKGYINCYATAENTDAKRKAGSVAAMQMAADAVLNLIASFHLDEIPIKLSDGTLFRGTFDTNPIKIRLGYDGWVGPSTVGLVTIALALAGSLKTVPDDVAPAFMAPNEAVLARQAAAIADYLNDVAAHYSAYVAAYKAQIKPAPMIIPTEIPAVAKALKTQTKKFNTGQLILGGTVTAAALGALTAALMRKKGPEGEVPMTMPGMMGAHLRRRRHADLGQLEEGMSTGKKVAIGAGVVALLIGGAALYAHIVYGDWRCSFRQCVVAPGWHTP